MEGTVDIQAFREYLERHDLVISPRVLVENRLKLEKKRNEILRKKMITFREICESAVWGENLQQQSVKAYAKKYAKPDEIIQVKRGQKSELKITIGAVERIAKQRGTWHTIAK